MLDILLFLSVFWAPPLFAFLIGAGLLFFFPGLYEFLIAAFFLDALYGAPLSLFGGSQFVFSFAALALFALSNAVKQRMRFY